MKPPRSNKRVSKPKHRAHQHLVEVSVRRDIARAQRIRAVVWFACKAVLAVVIIVGSYVGGRECLRRFLWENPDYYLAELRVSSDGTLTHEQVRTTSKIELGRNIFTIDLAKAREELDRLPQVERVELQRVLPNRIDVNITERRPIAWVVEKAGQDPTVSEKSFLVDTRGIAMRIRAKLPEYLSLPVIVGVSSENLVLGQRVRTYEMQAALDLIRFNTDNTRFQPRTLDISKGYCVVVTDQLRRKITFGLEGVDRQVERLLRYLDFSEANGKQIQTVNLIVERNTPVFFADSAPPDSDSAPPQNKPSVAKDKDAKTKSVAPSKKAEPPSTPTSVPDSTPPKTPTPLRRPNGPADSLMKPFRLNG